MNKQIAVFVDKNGETTSLFNQGILKIYAKEKEAWQVLREEIFHVDRTLGVQEIHQRMKQLIDFLGDCKIFLGKSVLGIPYFELEKGQCDIWEFEGKAIEFLDYIIKKEEEEWEEMDREKYNAGPIPTENGDGSYEINLKKIQASGAGVSSKQALLPFLRQGEFYQLEIICSHIPGWIGGELSNGNFQWSTETLGVNEIRIVVRKKTAMNMNNAEGWTE